MTSFAAGLLASGGSGNFVESTSQWWHWAVLLGLIVSLLLFDLLVLHRTPKVLSTKRAAIESAAWIAIGLGFTFAIWAWFGVAAAGEYISGYLIEESLSVDNVFVWALILSYFLVPPKYQHRVLFWGIFGALILRATFIFAGVAIIQRFDWVLYIFGAFLLYTAGKLVFADNDHVDPGESRFLKIATRIVPSTDQLDGQKLFTVAERHAGWRRRCSRCCCWSRRPTSCSPSTACRPCSPSATSSSSCSPRTRSRSWVCGRCTS